MIAIFDALAWAQEPLPWSSLRNGTLVIVHDPTRGASGIRCYLIGRVRDGKVAEWRAA